MYGAVLHEDGRVTAPPAYKPGNNNVGPAPIGADSAATGEGVGDASVTQNPDHEESALLASIKQRSSATRRAERVRTQRALAEEESELIAMVNTLAEAHRVIKTMSTMMGESNFVEMVKFNIMTVKRAKAQFRLL